MNDPKEGDNLFLYGTLRTGQRAFYKLEGKVDYLGLTTLSGASLYHLGGFPGLKLEDNGTIRGELFRVTDKTLFQTLDKYEGYPYLYDRQYLETTDGPAWVYVFNGEVKPETKIVSGDWFHPNKEVA